MRFPTVCPPAWSAFACLMTCWLSTALPCQRAAAKPRPPKPGQAITIVFVGNSLTSYHDLPAMVRCLGAAETPPRQITTVMLAPGGCTLQQHWLAEGAEAPRTVLQQPADFVVLQEQSRRPIDAPAEMADYAAKFAALAQERKVVPVWYETWARAAEPATQAALSAAYADAQRRHGGLLAPVGSAWQQALRTANSTPLHSDDGLHPTPAGTYLAALVLHATMCGADVSKAPDRLVDKGAGGPGQVVVELPAKEAARLRAAAAQALKDGSKPLPRTGTKTAK